MSATTPETTPILDSTWIDETYEDAAGTDGAPRYALQRAKAARLGNLPRRMLLSRARFVSDARRRLEESAEEDAFPR